ncbi:MAG: agmatine deiminase family protein [Alphaproteobacteria bacterium]|nr:agmatine deiminase family protein [Alphaproteobacteria bacterium]
METTVSLTELTVPPEWAPQTAIWTAWPANTKQWGGDLEPPRRDLAALARALAPSNTVRVLANGEEAEESARASVGDVAEIVPARYGDVWLRDTGPIFARNADGLVALRFETNGWGGKFDLPDDHIVGDAIAGFARVPTRKFDFILEGGAIEQDGEGTIITTRDVMLNANRNAWTERAAEAALREAFAAEKIIWLDEGLRHDHTDGHIDNVARFVEPGRVVCQTPSGPDDPNADILDAVARALEGATDAQGRKLEVIRIPSPGLVRGAPGEPVPASHMNFLIANGVVVMPAYGTPTQDAARDALQSVFPNRTVIALNSRGLLGSGDVGGGSFHCSTLQEPL